MSVILVISVLLRILAASWSLVVMRRLRDRRILFLTAMLVLMTTRQVLTLFVGFSSGLPMMLDLTAHMDELPGLAVSLMAFLVVLNLEGIVTRGFGDGQTQAAQRTRGVLIVPALAIGLMSILGIVVVACFAYKASRDAIRQTAADENLALGRTVCDVALGGLNQADQMEKQDAVKSLGQTWARAHSSDANAYLCVIGPSGKLELHTLKPDMKGTDVSQVVVSRKSGKTVMQLLRSQASWSGQNTNFRGIRQLVGYHYEPSIDSLVAVHIPANVVDTGFQAVLAPWIWSMILIGGLMLPFSLGLLFHSSRQANAQLLASLTARSESEERYRRLVENSTICINEIELDGTLSSMNAAGLWMMGLSVQSDIFGVEYLSAVSERDKPHVSELLDRARAGRTVDFGFETPNGQILESCFVPLTDGTGTVHRIMGITRDVTDRKHAEEALRRSESIQRSIMESSLDSIMLLDLHENILFINRTAPGLTPDQVINTSICQYVAEEFHPRMRDCFRHVQKTGQPDGYQVEYALPDDTITLWETKVAPVWTDNQVTGLTVIARDETKRLRAEQALRESERSLAEAQQIARVGNWKYDVATGQPSGSVELFRIIGLSESAPLPTMESFVSEFVHPDDHEIIARSYKQTLANGATGGVEFRLRRRPNRRLCHVRAEARVISARDGTPQAIIGTLQDISEQKRVELELRESEEKFRVLTERSPAIVLIARSERIVYGNATLSTLTGYSNGELLNMHIEDIVHPEHRELVADRHRRRMNGEEVAKRYNVKVVTKSGDDRWLDLSAQLIDFEGSPAVLVTCVDVTERKMAEEQLRQKESQLAHVSRLSTMGEMVAGIAHEINQPLSAIANFALASKNTIEATDYEFDAPVERWLHDINEQAVRCGDIIRRLRNFVKKGDDDREWTDLTRVVRESVALIESDIRHKSVVIDCRLPDPGPRVHINEIQLQQVIVNLLRNACDATTETATPKISIYVEREDGCARLTIEDNGRGVEESQRQKLFDTFFTTNPDGMGMGLAISKSIIEAQGGNIRFDPGTTPGATFHIELPIAEATKESIENAG